MPLYILQIVGKKRKEKKREEKREWRVAGYLRRASGLVLWPEEHGGGDGSGREVITLVNHSNCGIGTLLRHAAL